MTFVSYVIPALAIEAITKGWADIAVVGRTEFSVPLMFARSENTELIKFMEQEFGVRSSGEDKSGIVTRIIPYSTDIRVIVAKLASRFGEVKVLP